MEFLEIIEQPFVLTAIAILAALVDLISHAPVLLLIGFLVLAGVHRSKKLSEKNLWRYQVPIYSCILFIVSALLFEVHVLLERSTSHFVDDIVAKVVKALPKPEKQTPMPTLTPNQSTAVPKIPKQDARVSSADPSETGYLRSIPESIRFDTPPMYLWIKFHTTNMGKQIMPGALILSFIRVRPHMSAKEEDELFGQFNAGGGEGGLQTTERNYWEAGDSKVGMETRGGPDFKTVDGLKEEMDNVMDGTNYIYFFVRHLFFDKKVGRLATESCFYFKGPVFSGAPHECHGHNGPAKWPGTK